MLRKIEIFAYSNILFAQTLFFSLLAILGLKYQGSSESSSYTIYLLASSVLVYLFVFIELIQRKKVNNFLIGLFAFVLAFVFFILIGPKQEFVFSQSSLFFVLVLPAALVGYVMAKKRLYPKVSTYFFISAWLVFIGVFKTIPVLLSLSVIDLLDVFGGGQYQSLSYFCSFSILTLYRNLTQNINLARRFKLLHIIALIVLFVGLFLSGGRGGLIVVILGIIIFQIRKSGFLALIKSAFVIFTSVLLIIYLSDKLGFSYWDRVLESFDRLFSFVSSSGIDMEGTSNRGDFYGLAMDKISDSIIWGYGFFGLVSTLGDYYPHNIFLEIMLQGGLLYLSLFLAIIFLFFFKLYKIIKLKKDEDFILIPVVYSFVILLFSSSYLQEPFFWFSLAYVFSYSIKKSNRSTLENSDPYRRIPQ